VSGIVARLRSARSVDMRMEVERGNSMANESETAQMASSTVTQRQPGLLRALVPWTRKESQRHVPADTARSAAVDASDVTCSELGTGARGRTEDDPTDAPGDPGYWTPTRTVGVLCVLTSFANDRKEKMLDEFSAIDDAIRAGLVEHPPHSPWRVTARGAKVLEQWGLDRDIPMPARPAPDTRDGGE
jgi:hypothetical protein